MGFGLKQLFGELYGLEGKMKNPQWSLYPVLTRKVAVFTLRVEDQRANRLEPANDNHNTVFQSMGKETKIYLKIKP